MQWNICETKNLY